MPSVHALADAAPRRRKGEATAERILDAAEGLFAERGYAGTTLRDVAQRAGLRIPSLYNHFASKDSLYAAVLARGVGPVLEMLSEVVEGGADDDGTLRLIERVMELLAKRRNLARLVLHETLTGGEHLKPFLSEWIAPIFAKAQQAVEQNPGASRWQPEQIPLLVLALYHVVVGYFATAPFYRQFAGGNLLTEEALAAQTQLLCELTKTLFLQIDAGAPERPKETPPWT